MLSGLLTLLRRQGLWSWLVIGAAMPMAHAAPPETEPSAQRALSLDEALSLATKNNRDLAAARERLGGARADVEKALAALLPTLTAQGRLTINVPSVEVQIDQSGQIWSSAYQNAQISDLQQATGTAGVRGPATSQLYQTYCQNTDPNRVVPQGVLEACSMLGGSNAQNLDAAIAASNTTATLIQRAQVDGVLSANVPLIAPSAYPALKGARLNYEAQKTQMGVTEAQVYTSVATAYYLAAGTDELLTARRHAIAVAQKTAESANQRLAAGIVGKVDALRADLALMQTQQRFLEAVDNRAAAYRTLATMLRIDANSYRVQPPPEPRLELLEEPRLISLALDQRPELLTGRLQVRALDQQVMSAWLQWAPTLSMFGSLRLTNATGFSGRYYGLALGLSLDWTIFDGFLRDAGRHSLEAQRRELLLRQDLLRDTISDDVRNARRAVLTRRQGLLTAQRALSTAQETLELLQKQYGAGTITQIELLNGQDVLIQAEVAAAQARFDLALSVLTLRRLTGEPLASER